uniref:Secreted protein n=1 Tax=Magallana gigas TaxID=29159 RepID=A0A8W8NVB9_MAGGI
MPARFYFCLLTFGILLTVCQVDGNVEDNPSQDGMGFIHNTRKSRIGGIFPLGPLVPRFPGRRPGRRIIAGRLGGETLIEKAILQ